MKMAARRLALNVPIVKVTNHCRFRAPEDKADAGRAYEQPCDDPWYRARKISTAHATRARLEGLNGKEAKKQIARGRKQDGAHVAGGQDCYEAKKTLKSAASVKGAVNKIGISRNRIERRLGSAMKKSLGTVPSKRR
ncbi:hypothetical protein [Bradyrhizobium elkanii]|uniref:hypothetical protein n=1 Tax=Bradyrhizobium elkanii TaxID=29448 RepID=UPI002A12E876|nr:hypothetical protein [Bradyrhizobium elkanii]MCS3560329.1 hypothetical protein [Bradyrhizobium elkanii]MCW2149826.1 hypothetical protein [Bradyrhizobium elkanii]MCW2360204.1 hypothetical protein [Bradyrhizobium elkanii]MCW2373555.1 hypothetical protein [Bradyrhizobium elkanii]